MKELSKNERLEYWASRIGAIIAVVIFAFVFLLVLFINQIEASSGYTEVYPVQEVSLSDISSY